MRKYINYLIKNLWLETLIISFISIVISLFLIFISKNAYALYNPVSGVWIYSTPIVLSGVLMMTSLTSCLVVVCLRAYKLKSRAYVDMMYALPLERNKLVAAHLIVGLLQTIAIFTLTFISSIPLFNVLSMHAFNQVYIWLSFPFMLIYVVVFYGIFQFFVYQANNLVDAIGFNLLFFLILMVFVIFMQVTRIGDAPDASSTFDEWVVLPFYSMDKISFTFLWSATPINNEFQFYEMSLLTTIKVILNTIVYAVLSGLGYFHTLSKFKTDKTEAIGDVSTSAFGYHIQLPILFTLSVVFIGFMAFSGRSFDAFSVLPVVSIGILLTYFIYRRTIKIPRNDYMMMGWSIVLGIVLSFVLYIIA